MRRMLIRKKKSKTNGLPEDADKASEVRAQNESDDAQQEQAEPIVSSRKRDHALPILDACDVDKAALGLSIIATFVAAVVQVIWHDSPVFIWFYYTKVPPADPPRLRLRAVQQLPFRMAETNPPHQSEPFRGQRRVVADRSQPRLMRRP